MKSILVSASILAVSASGALAGGLDRSGQGIGIIFEEGGFVELSYGMVMPDVSGIIGGVVPSGNMAADYSQFGLGVKQDIGSNMSLALIMDQPFGAGVSYPGTYGVAPYLFAGTTADISSSAITAVARYKVSDRFSVHGGLRLQTLQADASIPVLGGYGIDVPSSSGTGYLVGAAYEIPDIALRVAVTYNSGIDHTTTSVETGGALPGTNALLFTTPQSVNLDFQSGIAADTLLFGSIRWVDWTAFDISPPGYAAVTGGDSLVSYDNDVMTYTLGVGRKFSDTFSGSIALGYEAATGDPATNLAPTDGFFSVQLGGKYTMGDMTISGGIRYVMIGDATTTVGSAFADNSAIGVGVKVGYSF